jgi:dipeptidyl aminopeptidase/acylaminoacyl peptidase
VQENTGKAAPVWTFQDLLETAHDETLFEHYFTSQLEYVDAATGKRQPVGQPGILDEFSASPDGQYLLLARVKRPYSRLVPVGSFARDLQIVDRSGRLVRTVADLPVAENVPINGVPTGPRAARWNDAAPATAVWVEALDEGNPRTKVPFRDRVVALAAPFSGEPTELIETEHRYRRIAWTERGVAFVTEYDRQTRWTRTWLLDAAGSAPRKLWDRRDEDRYGDPGLPMSTAGSTPSSFGETATGLIQQRGNAVFLRGEGASPQGDRPFLDRLDLGSLKVERIFQSDAQSYEFPLAVVSDDGRKLLTRRETRTEPPNVFLRDLASNEKTALTSIKDPYPQLTAALANREFVTYERKDGVKLSGTLYVPTTYKKGDRVPLYVWAYPREFADPAAASQVVGSPNRFTIVGGASHLLLLTQGYAIFDGPTMPIVGPGETANDSYVEQLVASAQAAVDKAVEMGIADRDRAGIGGHSYGGFMTANLLAHSDIFRAGTARSGAYNRTLTPFGFQNERRTFWEAPEIYGKMSPFFHAHKINEPILLIHGEMDDNSGTYPIQSERLYMALKGHGATVRYVTLPYEAHGYLARESVLHAVAEMLNWMNTHVKNAGPRSTTTAAR